MVDKPLIAIGLEGSANKLGVGIIDSLGKVYANLRKTYITPPGQGFLPKDTAAHHQKHVLPLITEALGVAQLQKEDIDVICFTKGRSLDVLVVQLKKLKWRQDPAWAPR